MKVVPVFALSVIALAGCSNPKEANKSNFEHAVNEWIEKLPPCLDVPNGTVTAPGQKYDALPAYVEAVPKTQPFAEESRQRRLAPLDALVDAGLMKKTPTEIEQQNMFGGAERKVAVIAYDFTNEGTAALRTTRDPRRWVVSGLAYATGSRTSTRSRTSRSQLT
jgi:hypothetical protein